MKKDETFLTLKQAATVLGISVSEIRKYHKRGCFPIYRIAGVLERIASTDFSLFIIAQAKKSFQMEKSFAEMLKMARFETKRNRRK